MQTMWKLVSKNMLYILSLKIMNVNKNIKKNKKIYIFVEWYSRKNDEHAIYAYLNFIFLITTIIISFYL